MRTFVVEVLPNYPKSLMMAWSVRSEGYIRPRKSDTIETKEIGLKYGISLKEGGGEADGQLE